MESVDTYSIVPIYSFDTELSADSVEWCPHKPNKNYFVCANYQLNSVNGNTLRKGRILLFSVACEGLELKQTIITAAVLDQKWCHQRLENCSILGVVNSEKTLQIYKLNCENRLLEVVTSYQIVSDKDELLILSLDWSTGKFTSNEPEIVCSDSSGNWHIFIFTGKELALKRTGSAHNYEAWIAAFYYWDTDVFFTGGDDSFLLQFDQRVGIIPVLKSKAHSAGVTCIHSNSAKEFRLVSGSYDEVLHLWDLRNMKMSYISKKMPGPLWRLKWDPFSFDQILSACMLGGVHIVNTRDDKNLNISASFQEHKSIAYGADWCFCSKDEINKFTSNVDRLIGTCSFYDHLLYVSGCKL